MVSTGPLRPPKPTGDQDEEDADQSATFSPLADGEVKDPPTQTCDKALSQYNVLTGPERPEERAWKVEEDREYAIMFGDDVEETEEKEPPMKRVPLAVESDADTVEFDQHSAVTTPPAFVLPIARYPPSDDRTNIVSPSDEKEGVDEDEADEGEYQSRPQKEPPKPTRPMREKSTCGREDGAAESAMAARMKGERMASRMVDGGF